MNKNHNKTYINFLLLILLIATHISSNSFAETSLENVCTNRSFDSSVPEVKLGNFWDPQKSGHGWNISITGNMQNIVVTWFTYDQHGRPRWYIASKNVPDGLKNGTEYQMELARVTKLNEIQDTTNIGILKFVLAPNGDSRLVAMDWFLDSGAGASIDIGISDKQGVQCLQSFSDQLGGGTQMSPSAVFNGLWGGNMSYISEFYSTFDNSGQGTVFDNKEIEHNQYYFYSTVGDPSWGISLNVKDHGPVQSSDPVGGEDISVVNSTCGYPPWTDYSGCTLSTNVGKFHRTYYEEINAQTGLTEWKGNAWISGSNGYSSGTGANTETISFINMAGSDVTSSFPIIQYTYGNTGDITPDNNALIPETPPTIAPHVLSTSISSSLTGFTTGNFNVDESGAVNYQVPIFALPGTGGLKPDMSISYNSNSGNGVAGMGWNIGGISSITRCLKNKEQDGIEYSQQKPITLTNEDAFCLDGQKLLLVSGTGNNGANGAEYRTEIESFQRIKAVGVSGNGPKKFTIHLKNGEIRTYGSSNSYFTAQVLANDNSNTVVQWLLNKVQDRNGNKIWYKWDTSNLGQAYIERIEWTRISANENPQNSMDFIYETRSDVRHAHSKGISNKLDKRLSHVITNRRQTINGSLQQVRSLKLDYETSSLTGRSLLSSIKECKDATHSQCLKPIDFDYSGDGLISHFEPTYSLEGGFNDDFWLQQSSKFVDINGDGIQEMIFSKKINDSIKFYMALHQQGNLFNLSGMSCTTENNVYYNTFCDLGITTANTSPESESFDSDDWYILDYDLDGKQDLLTRKDSTGNWHVFKSNGNRVCVTGASGCSTTYDINTGIEANLGYISNLVDMTGDGISDFITSQLYQGGPGRKLKLHKMTRNSNFNAIDPYYFESTNNASFIELVSEDSLGELIPEMFPDDDSCLFNVEGLGAVPCYTLLTSIKLNSVSTGVTDINGDGFNDAIVNFSIYYEPEVCADDGTDPLPSRSVTNAREQTFVEEEKGTNLGFTSCFHKHVAVFTFNPNYNNGPAFLPYKWIGGRYFKNEQGPPTNPVVNYSGTIQDSKSGVLPFDINGDGLSDLIIKQRLYSAVDYKINTGSGFTESKRMISSLTRREIDKALDNVQLLDYDRDGDIDVLYPQVQIGTNATKYYLKKYSGDIDTGYNSATLTSLDHLVSGTELGETSSYFLDINGDAHIDHLWFDFVNKTQKVKFGSNRWSPNDKMTKFKSTANNGRVSDTQITYESGYLPTVYSRLNNGRYQQDDFGNSGTWGKGSPVFDVAFPEYYVRAVSTLAPTEFSSGNRSSVYYHYQGLRVQGGGRGMLGFAKISTVDEQNNIYTVTSYNQDFPYTGLPFATEKGHLSTLTNTTTTCSVFANSCGYNICIGESCKDPLIGNNYVDPISDGINEYKLVTPASSAGSVFPYVWKTIDEFYELGSSTSYKMNITKKAYENTTLPSSFYGNVSSSLVKSCIPDANGNCNTRTKTTTINTYDPSEQNESSWILGRLTKAVTSNWRIDDDSSSTTFNTWLKQETTANFDYNNSTGQLETEEIEGDAYSHLKTIHVYDGYGNETKTIICSSGINDCENDSVLILQPNRSLIHSYTRRTYDTNWHAFVDNTYGLYGTSVNTTTPAFEKIESHVISRDIYGNTLKASDIYGSVSESKYGLLGELQTSKNATGAMSKTTKGWCPGLSCPNLAATYSISTAAGSPTKRQYMDILGRVIRTQTQSMNGLWSTVNTWYDESGRVSKVSQPHMRYENGTLNGTEYSNETYYDDLGRTTFASIASHLGGNVSSTYTYDGLTSSATNPKGQKKTTIKDVSDKVVEIQEFNGNTLYSQTNYYFGARGNLIKMLSEDDNGADIITTMTYDALGRKTSMSDPSKGNWSYTYNAMGKIIKQVDSLGQEMYSTYDMRGRKVEQRSVYEASEQRKLATWRFDQRNFWGMLTYSQENILAEVDNTTLSMKEVFYDFDTYGRSRSTFTLIDDGQSSGFTDSYQTSITYDQFGRVFQSFDASGYGSMMQFNAYGYQTKMFEALPCQDQAASSCANYNGKNYRLYYEAIAMDSFGNITSEKQHNGAIHTKRSYHPQDGFLDKICSSESDALATSCTSNNILQKLSFGFDAIGNLVSKNDATDTETYQYDHLNRLEKVRKNNSGIQLLDENYTYGTTGNLKTKNGKTLSYNGSYGPYAVTSHDGTTFSYNSNGDMTESYNGVAPKQIKYTSFSKPYYIKNKANGNTSEFFYGTGNSRFVRKDVNAGITTITHYVGGIELVRKVQTGSIEHVKRYIGGSLVIDMPGKFIPQDNWSYDYLLKDHIGSTHRIVSIDGDGNVDTQKLGFNAWGQRRNVDSLADIQINSVLFELNQVLDTTTHGFTGHEHLDGVGLIHMNGRIYDPALGRFLQADPIIQDPFNTQSLNRYSYVFNNPLTFTDPSGYFSLKTIFNMVRPFVAIAITIALPGAGIWAAVGIQSSMTIAIISGTIAGAVSSGTLKGALIGGLTAGAFKGVGSKFGNGAKGFKFAQKIAAHGAVGGVSTLLQGGKFGHGFFSAGVTQAFSGQIDGIDPNLTKSGKRIIAAAILGGSTSALTGGKFANGAITGAFSRGFNDEFHNEISRNAVKGIAKELKTLEGFEFSEEDARDAFKTAFGSTTSYKTAIKRALDGVGKLNQKQIDFGLEIAVVLSVSSEIVGDIGEMALSAGRTKVVKTIREAIEANEKTNINKIANLVMNREYGNAGMGSRAAAALYATAPNSIIFIERFGND